MSKLDRIIDIALDDQSCAVISPGFIYKRDDNNTIQKIDRSGDNLYQLENKISESMKNKYQIQITEILEEANSVLYIDCAAKSEIEISLDGFRSFMESKNIKYLNIYLDKINYLSLDQQKDLNGILSKRFGIGNDKRICLKINNGANHRKTRETDLGQRVEPQYNFSEYRIYQDFL